MEKYTFIDILQRRSDKVTTEQFWVVALLSGAGGVLILQHSTFSSILGAWLIILVMLVATLVGTVYIIGRHSVHLECRREIFRLVEDEPLAPDYMRRLPTWGGYSLFLNYGFYTAIIWVVWIALVIQYA